MNLNLQGAPNARDLGGLRTADGRTVRPGLLLRSGELSRLTATDAEALQRLNLKTVVDFRTERERAQKPDVKLPGVQYIVCPIIRELAVGITREEEANAVPPMVRAASMPAQICCSDSPSARPTAAAAIALYTLCSPGIVT